MSDPVAIVKLFQPELARIYARHGEAATHSVIASLDSALQSATKAVPAGGVIDLPSGWPDWNAIEAQLTGVTVAQERKAALPPVDLITLTPDGLAKIVAAAREQPDEVTDIEYDHYGADGKPTRITRRARR